jgi:tripartite-type tricarboxylate transporter receptor subunit TctC
VQISVFKTFLCSSALLISAATPAQNYPSRPIRFLVPGAAGSSQDILARVLATKLSQQMGQQFVVDDRAGATGIIAIDIARTAAPDGYTLVAATSSLFSGLPALKPKLSYDPDRDFAPLSRMASVANVVTVNVALGVESAADLIKLAKAKPGQLNYGSAGNGSPAHIAGAMFDVLAGVKTNHVPYKGSAQAITDLMAGQLQYLITSPLITTPHAKGGRVRMLATTGTKRDPLLPDLPVLADILPGYEITQWWGVVAPAKTPPDILKLLHAEIIKALRAPEVRELLARQGAAAQPESPAEFAAFMKAERIRIGNLGRKAGISLE